MPIAEPVYDLTTIIHRRGATDHPEVQQMLQENAWDEKFQDRAWIVMNLWNALNPRGDRTKIDPEFMHRVRRANERRRKD